jgi:hypothetical protein
MATLDTPSTLSSRPIRATGGTFTGILASQNTCNDALQKLLAEQKEMNARLLQGKKSVSAHTGSFELPVRSCMPPTHSLAKRPTQSKRFQEGSKQKMSLEEMASILQEKSMIENLETLKAPRKHVQSCTNSISMPIRRVVRHQYNVYGRHEPSTWHHDDGIIGVSLLKKQKQKNNGPTSYPKAVSRPGFPSFVNIDLSDSQLSENLDSAHDRLASQRIRMKSMRDVILELDQSCRKSAQELFHQAAPKPALKYTTDVHVYKSTTDVSPENRGTGGDLLVEGS